MASNANDVAINMNNLSQNDENASNSNPDQRPSRTLSPNRANAPVNIIIFKTKIYQKKLKIYILLQTPRSRTRSRSPRVPRSTVPLLENNDTEEFSPDGDPPKANPEMDDDEFEDERPINGRPQAGVDDAFFPDEPRRRNNVPSINNGGTNVNTNGGNNPRNIPLFPYGPQYTPQGVVSLNLFKFIGT